MVQISLKLARREAPADGKNGACREDSEVTESLGDSSSDFAAAPASILELQHENREKTQQVQMLRETLSIIKVTMSRNDALLQEKIQLLDQKTSECEQLKIKCEGLVREKASAVAQWKKKYEFLAAAQEAQTEQEATQRARAARPPSPDALLGMLPKHPWRCRGTSALALSSRGSGSDQLNDRSDSEEDDEDSIDAPSPVDAVFREDQTRLASSSSRSGRLSGSSRSSKRSRKSAGKRELPTFAPVSMEWVTSATLAEKPSGKQDESKSSKSVASNKSESVKDEEHEDAKAPVDIEEVVELPSMRNESSDESSMTEEVVEEEEVSCEYEEVTVEEDFAEYEYEEETLRGSSITMESDANSGSTSISSKDDDHKQTEFESMWHDDHESDDQCGLPPKMDAVDNTPSSFHEDDEDDLIFSKHSVLEAVEHEEEDHDDDDNNIVDDALEQQAAVEDEQQPKQEEEEADAPVPAAVHEGGEDNMSAISQDCEPVLDKQAARLLRRKLRRRARIQRTAHKKSEQAGYEIVQVEC